MKFPYCQLSCFLPKSCLCECLQYVCNYGANFWSCWGCNGAFLLIRGTGDSVCDAGGRDPGPSGAEGAERGGGRGGVLSRAYAGRRVLLHPPAAAGGAGEAGRGVRGCWPLIRLAWPNLRADESSCMRRSRRVKCCANCEYSGLLFWARSDCRSFFYPLQVRGDSASACLTGTSQDRSDSDRRIEA